MPTITDHAIVIRRWDFSETSQTVSLLTREHGIIRGLAKGAKRQKANFSGGLDLLHEGEIVAIVKAGRELATLTAWHLRVSHRVLHENLHANRLALYMADLIHHMLIDHDPHAGVFDALSGALALIDDDAANADLALLRLQWAVLNEAGYKPELRRDAQSGAPLPENARAWVFSAAAGGVLHDEPQSTAHSPQGNARSQTRGAWRVRPETINLLRDLAERSDLSSAAPETLRRANRLLTAYAREIIGSEPPAMRWAFPDLASPSSR